MAQALEQVYALDDVKKVKLIAEVLARSHASLGAVVGGLGPGVGGGAGGWGSYDSSSYCSPTPRS